MAQWTEEEIDIRIGTLLKWSILLASVVMLIGGVVFLYHNGTAVPDYKAFRKTPPQVTGDGLIQLAVLLIVATPVARVLFAAYAFARMRDWLYAVISLTVLSLLLFAIVHSV